jgi:hypothetical protein
MCACEFVKNSENTLIKNITALAIFARAGLFALFLASQSSGATVVSVSGTTFTEIPVGAVSGGNGQVLAASWSSTTSFTGVTISALLTTEIFGGNPTGDVTGQAYLMTAIGPGTTVASQIATAPFLVSSTFVTPTNVTLFSGLTLGPGTYDLVLDNPANSPRFYWVTSSPTTVTVAPGTTHLPDSITGNKDLIYAPASPFAQSTRSDSLEFTVTGTAGAPEPATFSMFALGVLTIMMSTRRKRPS